MRGGGQSLRTTPSRPDDRQITQPYRDGVVRIYTVTDAAQPGYQPRPALTLLETLFYQERRVGLQRYYSGKQAQVQVERVIRTQLRPGVSPQCVAITEDGVQYGIDLVQRAEDVYPASMDLTLTKIDQKYEPQGPWEYPKEDGDYLIIRQVYGASEQGDGLELI